MVSWASQAAKNRLQENIRSTSPVPQKKLTQIKIRTSDVVHKYGDISSSYIATASA
jgi:hypothetical protein